MIFYFTGTGNSLYVAKELDEEIISIPQVIKQERPEFVADSIGIVCPVYGNEMPGMVKEFLRRASLDIGYLFVVLTYGAHHGGAAEIADRFIQSVGKKADYITSIEMVDNFLPVFDMNEQMAKDKQVKKHLDQVWCCDLHAGTSDRMRRFGSTSETSRQDSGIQQSETLSPASDEAVSGEAVSSETNTDGESGAGTEPVADGEASTVYFTSDITPEGFFFLLDYIAVMSLFIFIGHYLAGFLRQHGRKKKA